VNFQPAPGTSLDYSSILGTIGGSASGSPSFPISNSGTPTYTKPTAAFTLTIGGTPKTLVAQPIPIQMKADTAGVLTATPVLLDTTTLVNPGAAFNASTNDYVDDLNSDGKVDLNDLYIKLGNLGITEFRYLITDTSTSLYTTGTVTVAFQANAWQDTAGDKGTALTQTFTAQGVTVNLANPMNGAPSMSPPSTAGTISTWPCPRRRPATRSARRRSRR